jgi:hypothetical protein
MYGAIVNFRDWTQSKRRKAKYRYHLTKEKLQDVGSNVNLSLKKKTLSFA